MVSPLSENVTADFQIRLGDWDPGRGSTASVAGETPREQPLVPNLLAYSNLRPLGAGGMGVVFQGVQRGTERVVALKFLHLAVLHDPSLRLRFANEARALARIQHPHIVQIFEVGESIERPYFAMEFLSGGTLGQRVRKEAIPLADTVRWMIDVANAVESAHQAGVLHRDLKPGNVLLTADDQVKVSDFGLAKFSDSEDSLTMTGAMLGTPSYMAPEQADGQLDKIDARTDVYALGALLYELLTRQPPFKGANHAATLEQVRRQAPVPPRQFNPEISSDLEAVCLKCLEKRPEKRYATAAEFAEELNRIRMGESTRARPVPAWRRFLRRHRTTVSLAMAIPALSLASVPVLRDTDHRARIENGLAKGVAQQLISPEQMPAWYRWRMAPSTIGAVGPNRSVSFQTFQPSFLELVTDPRTDNYRIVAELRHVSGLRPNPDPNNPIFSAGQVGIGWGMESWPVDDGTIAHRLLVVDYCDFAPGGDRSKPGPYQQQAKIVCVGSIENPGLRYQTSRVAMAPPVKFIPADKEPGPWREIIVDVSPEKISAMWRDNNGKLVSAGEVTADQIQQKMTNLSDRDLGRFTHDLCPPGPLWQPRKPIGVWALNSMVEVRSFRVEPLSP